LEEISEAPTMDTTQLITMMKLSGISEATIQRKLTEWANSAPDAAETESTSHGEAYEYAQSVNLSLKRYLDAEDMKVKVSEHKVETMKALYESKKSKSK
jgi:1,2-phenylacetyl-CoA epoxidase catalytic subunit